MRLWFFVILLALCGCSLVTKPKSPKQITYTVNSEGTKVSDGGCNASMSFQQNGTYFYGGWCYRGFNIAVIDQDTGDILDHGRNFDTWISEENKTHMLAYLDSIPSGRILLVGVCDDAGLINRPDYPLTPVVKKVFADMGSKFIGGYHYRAAWAFIAVKGSKSPLAEAYSERNGEAVTVEATLSLP